MKRFNIAVTDYKGKHLEETTICGDIISIQFDNRIPHTLWITGSHPGYKDLPYNPNAHAIKITPLADELSTH